MALAYYPSEKTTLARTYTLEMKQTSNNSSLPVTGFVHFKIVLLILLTPYYAGAET